VVVVVVCVVVVVVIVEEIPVDADVETEPIKTFEYQEEFIFA
jgi:hypothetical protein